jgi:crotonobetaine/carnitine-CoA ligase
MVEPVGYLTVPAALAAASERFAARPALVTAGGQESFQQLAERCGAAAANLRSAGIEPGERLLITAPNSGAAIHAWLGVICAGAIPAAVNPELTRAELEYLAADLDAAAVLADGPRREPAARLGLPVHAIEDLDTGARPVAAPDTDPMQPAAVVYTSGTTSRPKGVMVRHAAYTETGASFPGWIGLGRAERLWACLPLFHINAQAYSLMSCLMHGHSVALTAKFHASTFWHDARELGVTSVNVIGAMLTFLARQPHERWVESGLHTVYAAPAPPPDERRELESRFRLRITGGYGMSENTFGCAESPTSRDKPGSVGRPRQPASGVFVNELRIVGDDGRKVTGGETGELWFRNPVMTPGYWNAEEVTARTIVDGWLRTGDLGRLDDDGDVTLAGRAKEMIRRRGENISPGEVEDALAAHPAVASAAAFGVPSEASEEEVIAAVVLAGGRHASEDELRDFARQRLAAYKLPSAIVFRDSLPMTATMRVARDRLRAEYLRDRRD